jgi:hypothetical protein
MVRIAGPFRKSASLAGKLWLILMALMSFPLLSVSQVNSWTNGSANWHDSYWSLGVLPDENQLVMLTNAGWKAVAIGAATAQQYPQTMQVRSVTISSPTNSYNVLLFNFAGLETPFQTPNFILASNSAVVALSSRLVMQTLGPAGNTFSIGGEFSQGDFAVVTVAGMMNLGDIGPGKYNLTNGILTAGQEFMGGAFPTVFTQYGGSNGVSVLHMHAGAAYHLHAGQLGGGSIVVGRSGASAHFQQTGGAVTGDLSVGGQGFGKYTMSGGTFSGRLSVPPFDQGAGTFVQSGGTNTVMLMPGLEVGHGTRFGGNGDYFLSNGVLSTVTTSIRALGTFVQHDGTHRVSNGIVVSGSPIGPTIVASAQYSLIGGNLSASGLSIMTGTFAQSGGTNQLSGDLTLAAGQFPSRYLLTEGLLLSSNVVIAGSYSGGFSQTGGSQVISDLLSVFGTAGESVGFLLSGGTMTVKNILISDGATFQHTGGLLIHTGLLTLANGTWQAGEGEQSMGRLGVRAGNETNSNLIFPWETSKLHFENSSSVDWTRAATLTIKNWNGSLTGGGQHQITVGANQTGLTAQQLSQIRFEDPAGKVPGVYEAEILDTGEVVPGRALGIKDAQLSFSRNGNILILTWPQGWTLQTATNVAGPYEDVPASTGSFEVPMTGPSQFFRLKP